jgi:AcrR family transcriptional regulator
VTERAPRHPRDGWHQSRGRARRHAPARRALSRDAIIAAALHIVDRDGVDAVTMRAVAEELDTGAASLYAHVQDKDELLAAVFDHVLGDVVFEAAPDRKRWQEQVKEFSRMYLRVLLAHNDLAKVSLGSIPTGSNGVRGMEAMLSVLAASGMPGRVVGYASDLLGQFVTVTAYETAVFHKNTGSPKALKEFEQRLLRFFGSLSPERFPTITSLAVDLVQPDEADDARFEFGLDIIVRGLAAHAPPQRRRG